jgi:hypothetical protein
MQEADWMGRLVAGHWQILPEYWICGFVLQLCVRLYMSFLSALFLWRTATTDERFWRIFKDKRFWRLFRYTFFGWHRGSYTDIKSDLWYPFILGLIEIHSYPVLMVVHTWTAIGAWIGLKTVAQWQRWTVDRLLFQRYLIGTALVLVLSLWLTKFVTIK